MKKLLWSSLIIMVLTVVSVHSQDATATQAVKLSLGDITIQPNLTALGLYAKWREETLRNYAQGTLTPHYAVVIVAQRLDDSTAQVEMLIAAEMKQYTVSIKPVTLNRLASGETESKSAGNAVTIDQKAGDKFDKGADKIRIGQTMTTVPISKAVQALEIIWTPKNDNKDDFANTCIVQLGKEPAVTVNGYVLGGPVR